MNRLKQVLVAAVVGTSLLAFSQVRAEPERLLPLGSYVDCQNTCRDCQKSCDENVPAGSKRSDCIRACTAAASSCCSASGKNPPLGLTCTCS